MPRVLVLDDDDVRHEVFSQILSGCEVLHVHTAWEACRALQQSVPFDLACLDHDLGMFGPNLEDGFDADAGTGTDPAAWDSGAHARRIKTVPRAMAAGARRAARSARRTYKDQA